MTPRPFRSRRESNAFSKSERRFSIVSRVAVTARKASRIAGMPSAIASAIGVIAGKVFATVVEIASSDGRCVDYITACRASGEETSTGR